MTGRQPDTKHRSARRWWRRFGRDLLILGCYLALAVWVTQRLWAAPYTQALTNDPVDQKFLEWALAYGVHMVAHPGNPFYTVQVNAPVGANMMVNTSLLLPGVVLAPVTMIFGPAVSFVLLETVALAGTAAGWYVVLRRRLALRLPAAALGAGLIGFAPGMVALSNSHTHLTAQFFVPFIVLLVLPTAPGRPEHPVRRGVLLGLLVTAQCLTGTEILLIAGMGVTVLVVLLALLRPADARRTWRAFVLRTGTGAVVAGALLAYPMWMALAGPMHVHGTPWFIFSSNTDVMSWFWYSGYALVGGPDMAARVHSVNTIDETSYLGFGLVALLLAVVVWLRRNRTVLALLGTALVFVVLSFGTTLRVFRVKTGVPGPWALLQHVPVLEQALPDRLALVATTAFGVLLAIGLDRAARVGIPRPVRFAVLAVALVPILPVPLPTEHRAPVPVFFTSGRWREHVRPGHTMLAVPLHNPVDRRAQYWASVTGDDLAVPGGAIMVPMADGQAHWGASRSRMSVQLAGIARSGRVPRFSTAQRARALRDLAAARTDAVVLDRHVRHTRALRTAITRLLRRPGRVQGDVRVWDVRS